jgi:hypothetical protein
MLTPPIDALECFRPSPTAYVLPPGVTFVLEPDKTKGFNYDPCNFWGAFLPEMSDGELIQAAAKTGTFSFWDHPVDDVYNKLLNE